MLKEQNYHLSPEAKKAMAEYVALRRKQPHFANARSVRNALDRARLRQANRLFESSKPIMPDDLSTLEADDIHGSRVFHADGEVAGQSPR